MTNELLIKSELENTYLFNSYNFKDYNIEWELNINTSMITDNIYYILACRINNKNKHIINLINGIKFNNINDLSTIISNNIIRDNTALTEIECKTIGSLIKDIKTELNNTIIYL